MRDICTRVEKRKKKAVKAKINAITADKEVSVEVNDVKMY